MGKRLCSGLIIRLTSVLYILFLGDQVLHPSEFLSMLLSRKQFVMVTGAYHLPGRIMHRLYKLFCLQWLFPLILMAVMPTCGETTLVVLVPRSPRVLLGRDFEILVLGFLGIRWFGSKRRYLAVPLLFGLSFSTDYKLEIDWFRGLTLPSGCVLCSGANEYHSHLFFECSFAAAVWNRFCGRYLASPPSSVAAVVDSFLQLQGPHAPRAMAVLKLLNQVIIYYLWRERNARIFRDVSMTPEAFFKVVDRCMRDRLLSLPSVTASSPSLLELFFCFVSPYN